MKRVLLMYLEEEEKCVDRLLVEQGVEAFSRLGLEGHGQGGKGWRGNVPAYRSRTRPPHPRGAGGGGAGRGMPVRRVTAVGLIAITE